MLSVFPMEWFIYETVDENNSSMINVNQFVRITRISKLYKLVKITKLIRIIKIVKNKKKLEQKLKHVVKNGAALDRLMFFILIVFLMVHIMSCLWIFIASTAVDKNWIQESRFEHQLETMELYAAAMYFSMQTLTTVGYGDIAVSTTTERFLCILLQFSGVILFSFAAGSITNIVQGIDNNDVENQQRKGMLDRILVMTNHKLPSDLYA